MSMEEPVGLIISSFAGILGIESAIFELIIVLLGAALLGLSFHKDKHQFSSYSAACGWFLLGLFFYLQSSHYVEIADPLLIIMTAAALPGGIALGYWEIKVKGNVPESLHWFRGCVTWSVIPYFLVYSIPFLNIAFVDFTAGSTEWMLEFAGLGSYEVGAMRVDIVGQPDMTVSEWDGNKWFLTEPLGDSGFYVPFNHADGTPVAVSFILACSALQSMIIFVGAIGALSSVSLKRRLRGLLIALPTIHVLNVFRNAGIVWLADTYHNWSFMGIDIFDFSHSYAAKFMSLFAMFLLAISLFDLLPELHRNIIRIISPVTDGIEKLRNNLS